MDSYNGLYNRFHRIFFLLFILLSALCLQVTVSEEADDKVEGQGGTGTEEDDPWDTEKFKKEADQTYNLMFYKYNNRIRPPVPFVGIDLDVTLTHIRHLDAARKELQIILDVDLNWMDSRLRWLPYKVKEIHESSNKVWRPDLIYSNSIAEVKDLYPDTVRILHNGTISWIRKEIVTTRCETDPSSSVQTCPIRLGFATNNKGNGDEDRIFFSNKTMVTLSDGDISNRNWRVTGFELSVEDENKTMTSTLVLEVFLERTKITTGDADYTGDDSGNPGQRTTDNRVSDEDAMTNGGSKGDCNGVAASAHVCNVLLLLWSFGISVWLIGPLNGEKLKR